MSKFMCQVQKDMASVVMVVISCLVPILQHAEVITFTCVIGCFIFLEFYAMPCLFLLFVMHFCFYSIDSFLFWIVVLIENFDAAKGLNKSLIENSAITLGRLAWVCPELVSPHMEHFMQHWCIALSMYVSLLYHYDGLMLFLISVYILQTFTDVLNILYKVRRHVKATNLGSKVVLNFNSENSPVDLEVF